MSRSTGAVQSTAARKISPACARRVTRCAESATTKPMPMIRETIVTTVSQDGRVHIAPIGIIADGLGWIVAPFRPSTTLDNLRAVPFAVANFTDDVRIFAGCLTGRDAWPTTAADVVPVPRLV